MDRFKVRDIPRRKFLEMSLKGGLVVAATPALLSHLVSCGGAASGLDMDRETLAKVIARALASGGDYADIYIESRISRQIVMQESKFRSGLYGISQGAGVRVIAGNQTGYAYTDEITTEKLMRAAEVASYVARKGNQTSPVDLTESRRESFITVSQPLGEIADENRIEIIERANDAALGYDQRIKMAMIDYNDEVRSRVIATSEGVYLRDELPLLFFIVQAMSDDGKARHMARERLSYHSGFEMFDLVTPEQVAQNAAREAIAMLEAEDAPAGIMDVVMQNGWGGVLVHEAVGHPLEADNIAKGIGAFTGKVGKKVASDLFTMVDDGSIPNFRGTINFDDEGTQVRKNVLIENGVLLGYMTDVLSARQLGLERTGNGRRESFRYIPIPRMTNTYIEKGDSDPADILSSTKKGIYVQSLSGGSVNPVTGVFNFTCREAYLIENGKKTKPVKGATLIGSCMDVISNIDAVGNDLDFGPGICGKGQNAEVSAGQPTVRIRGINVGGSRA
ncbi:MAG: TldD/PmbA family protein [Bacteroidales bacterium]|jgi:TldD protein|nr:TldD/PmbA family protein [Bacteroidales bacterium]